MATTLKKILLGILVVITATKWLETLLSTGPNLLFAIIFLFRYFRLIFHVISYCYWYKPTPIPETPKWHRSDCTVVIPTVEPENPRFEECLQSLLNNKPKAIIIVTVGKAKEEVCKEAIADLHARWTSTKIIVTYNKVANKRHQILHALEQVETPIVILADDHMYWPSNNYLLHIIAPFEDSKVGGVGTEKRVRRTGKGWGLSSVFNFWGCIYLLRHNFEIAATNAIDGGVFVISARTAAYRTEILQDPAFKKAFADERFFFKLCEPLNPDDDNFITRWGVSKGWKHRVQCGENSYIETDLGSPHKYLHQCLRWSRTTWRSNSCSLFTDRTVWRAQPWCVYAVYITSFFNFALFFDPTLVYMLSRTTFGQTPLAMALMVLWIFATKMIKLIPHFRRHPADLWLTGHYIFFAYMHSFIKLYALLTFWNCAWAGRDLDEVDAEAKDDAPSEQLIVYELNGEVPKPKYKLEKEI